MKHKRSKQLFKEAQDYIPGGVNSPVRAFAAVGGSPLFIKSARGSRIYDEDDNEFIDYVCSWGPMILGHGNSQVTEAIKAAVDRGTSYGAPTELETTLGHMVCDAVPSIEMVRFVNSGTEATMSALRLARAFTGRSKILKFAGCYHGHVDSLLVKAGSGLATLGIPTSPGVPPAYAQDTLVAPYNNIEAVHQLFKENPKGIAAVIVEPVAANMGVVLPQNGFIEELRAITQRHGTLLVFDEVITGFRVAYGGAQSLYGIMPDLTCLGKIIGGGLPVGAYGGKKELMQMVAPTGDVYQAGTLSGNPLAMTAGIETLRILGQKGTYEQLEDKASQLVTGLRSSVKTTGLPAYISRIGSVLTLFFTAGPVIDYDSAATSDTALYACYFRQMLKEGIYLAPSQFEAMFVSLSHTKEDIQITIEAAERALKRCKATAE